MVKYSDDTEYEQIDLETMYELRDSRLVKAKIVSVDPDNNCANITIKESCDELSSKDLSAVPFFYHCEDSTGTLEDLERGHKAFMANQDVYCLWTPATGNLPERFYIIGHVNIRGIKYCKSSEVILLITDACSSVGYSGRFFCLLDALTGEPLNVVGMDNFDSSSPEKPADYWGEYNVDVASWIKYNFVNPTTSQLEKMDQTSMGGGYGPEIVWEDNGSTTSAYTGTQGSISSGGPVNCDLWFSAGNGSASMTSREISNTTTHQGSRTISNTVTGAFPSHANEGDNVCRAYFAESTTEYSQSHSTELSSDNGQWIRIDDDFDDGARHYLVGIWESFSLDASIIGELDSADGSYAVNYESSWEHTFNFGFFPIVDRPAKSITLSGGWSASFSGGWSDVINNTSISSSSGTGYVGTTSTTLGYHTPIAKQHMFIGMKGVYFIAIAGIKKSVRANTPGTFTGATNSMSPFWPNSVPFSIGADGTYTDNSPYCYGTNFKIGVYTPPELNIPMTFTVLCQALVSPFKGAFISGEQVLVRDVIENYDDIASSQLSNSVEKFFDNIYQFLANMTGVSDDRFDQFFIDSITPGLNIYIKTIKGS